MPAGRVDPVQPVEVYLDGAWVPALLDFWDRRPDGWWGHVTRYARDPAPLAFVEWHRGPDLRPRC